MWGAVLQVQDIYKSFGRRKVLRGVSFSVTSGTLVGIVGENGAGKTTLLRIVAGELLPNGGNVFRQSEVGYCPQTVVLNESLTVDQHLDFFRAAYNISDLSHANDLMEKLNFGHYRKELIANLSGGTKQKLNLTLALMHQPGLLLLDEPYQGFDWEAYLCFWDIVAELRAQSRSVLVISHLFFEQKRFDRLYRLYEGRILEEGRIDIQRKDLCGERER